MAEVRFNRLKGNVDRLERRIAYVNRGIKTSKKFAENIDTPEKLRKESLAKLKTDEKIIADLKAELKEATKALNTFVAERRSKEGKEKANLIESKYAKLEEALSLQFDPTSPAAEKIKADMEDLVDDYKNALTAVNKRAVNKIEARAELTKTKVPGFGTPSKGPVKPSVITETKPDVKKDTLTKTPLPNTGGDVKPTGDKDTSKKGANTSAFPQYSGIDTTTATGIAAASARPAATVAKTPLDTLLAKTEFWYDLPDYIFKVDVDPKTGQPGEIGRLLQEAVAGEWKNDKFLSKLQLTKWWQKNAPVLRTRIIDREKYNDLKASGEDVTKSDYGLYLSKQMRAVKAKAREIAGVTLTDEQAQSVAQKIYDGFLDDDPLAINALITPFIGKVSSIVGTGVGGKQTGFGGQALKDYQMLQGIARANGLKLKDILPNISAITAGGDLETAVLQGLANGDIDINRVAQDARMLAAQGQPQYVRNLLSQGYDLENIYAPYRQTMAAELDLNPDQIDLNDPTLRMAITDKGDMNIYDFKKALRQDNRWQYTSTAREEVSNSVLDILKDFGFQG
jgi:hypothetical protein